ncbi:hypothetical protein CEXT_103451 [Caerostris extrusa]|uniref:Uncharacterized protein n=1 Tax=Caerostris extrusa TaxID=172846 RepID=A0AAV4N5N4_CAEEX|nr:hypothetical protein CEXT_103451 [Caerostris extrusa]
MVSLNATLHASNIGATLTPSSASSFLELFLKIQMDPVTLTTRTKRIFPQGVGRMEDMINTEQIPCPVSQNPVVAHQSINNGTSPVFIWQVLLLSSVLKLSGANFLGKGSAGIVIHLVFAFHFVDGASRCVQSIPGPQLRAPCDEF